MAPKNRNKENTRTDGTVVKTPSALRAMWNNSCDSILIETLEKEKEDGRMTSNSSWHSSVWTAAEMALDGTERSSGGGKKTADSCHNRWSAVRTIINFQLFIYLSYCVHSSRRTMFKLKPSAIAQVLVGMMKDSLLQQRMKYGWPSSR